MKTRTVAVEAVITSQHSRLFDFIRKRVNTEEDAEDILQDVFYQLLAHDTITEPIDKLSSWLFAVARNRIVDWYRGRKHHGSIPLDAETGLPESPEDVLFDPTQEPDEVFGRALVWEALAEALDGLSEEQREVFILHEVEGRSFKEIAEITGENLNTLLSRKRYAVLYLREALKQLYNEW
jgi:RNA polymerase sigma factor (sigma-70 family)